MGHFVRIIALIAEEDHAGEGFPADAARAGVLAGEEIAITKTIAPGLVSRWSDLGVRDASLRLSGGVNASGTLTAHALYPNSGARSLAGSSTEGVNLGS